MPADEEMSVDERRKYLKCMARRYMAADKEGRGVLLSEMEAVTGLHRKSLIRLLSAGSLDRQPSRVERGRSYGPEVADALRVIWESSDYICAERLTPNLVPMAQHLARFGELHLSGEIERQLGEISEATVTRLLRSFRRDSPRLPRRGPERANRLARQIPMGRIPWEIKEPGHFEMDLVHHCGEATAGDYVHTLQLVDVATGWSERVGIFGRTYRAMVAGSEKVVGRLPFPIRELHPDNGSEFINDHILAYFGDKIKDLSMSRSRPYHKNDNRNVEQKNYTLVRAYLGYERLDTPAQSLAVNALYDRMWLYYNLFQPVMHLESKEVVGKHRIKRKWDEAKTPYERVLTTGVLSEAQRARLTGLYARTNPRKLRREIHQIIETLWDEPKVVMSLLRKLEPVAC
ncbi:MAG: transposase family protein [Chloroflexota bacterium]